MFDDKYFEWNQKRSKGIVDFYGYKFFYFKRILDLGCGYGDLGGVLYRLGSDVTAIDARQEHLKIVKKKYTGIKTVQANLDVQWPFHNQKFDLILDLGLLCHLADYESHLRAICSSTTHLILETAVCDSDDSQKCLLIDEDKATYDLAYSGKGCRPSPAAIERVLKECGMNFKRMDNAKFNGGNYTYDWYPKNDNSTSLQKRRIWFAVRDNSPVQFQNPNSEIATAPITIPPQGYIGPIINSGLPPTTASPKPPMHSHLEAEARARNGAANTSNPSSINSYSPKSSITTLSPSPIRGQHNLLPVNDRVREDSKEFSLIEPDNFVSNNISTLSGIISPNTFSSRMWYKKISISFPNLKLSKNVLTMPGFSKVDKAPDIIMCSLSNLQAYKRVWIDEWFGNELTTEHIKLLEKSGVIITPSLINAQEIWKHVPHAAIFRVQKPWPLLEVPAAEGQYYLYFEKSAALTQTLFNAWDPQYGNLVVVGSSVKVPSFATFVSNTESYVQIMKLTTGAKAIIDISENNYYASGINRLATFMNIPIITNNHIRLNGNLVYIQQDKKVSHYPTGDDIKKAINKFIGSNMNKGTINNPGGYQHAIAEDIRKILGV